MTRLCRLDLTRFGHFTDFSLDFRTHEPGKADLHIIFGPNESGKTTAFNISMANHDPESFEAAARHRLHGFRVYPRQNFMHIDTGSVRQWGDPFPPRSTCSGRTTRFAPEPPHLRDGLTKSRTMKGGRSQALPPSARLVSKWCSRPWPTRNQLSSR